MDTITCIGTTRVLISGDCLRVLVSPDCGQWFAQGVEVDYAACGNSIEDVQRRFEAGLVGTIHANLERHGKIDQMLKRVPRAALERGRFEVLSVKYLPDDISNIPFPFASIVYLEQIPVS